MNHRSGSFRRAALAFGFVAAALLAVVARAWLVRFEAVVVEGDSMEPALLSEDYVLMDSEAYANRLPVLGEVVLAEDPRDGGRTLLKRVAELTEAGIELRGDDAARSTDSREFGPVPAALLRGRVLFVYWPPLRFGRVR